MASSAEIGLINLISESSIGSTNRRIESLVGPEAFREFATERAIVSRLSTELKAPKDQLTERISDLMNQLKAAERKIAEYEQQALASRVPSLADAARPVGRVTAVLESVGSLASSDDLRSLATRVRERLSGQPAVVALAAEVGGKPAVLVATTPAAREAGVKAGPLAKTAAGVLGGGGGGKDDIAQGGGSDAAAIPAALEAIAAQLPR